MSDFYSDGARHFQNRLDTRRLADRAREIIVHDQINADDRALIEGADFFFLATVDQEGQPQCSYKGGSPGFVRVLDEKTIAFPSYDGNGMFLSLGNLRDTQRVGMLFLSFERPRRLRINGTATIADHDSLLDEYPEAQAIVRVCVRHVFVNCPRYVHTLQKVAPSPYVPRADRQTPFPDWKRKEAIRDVLPGRDKRRLEEEEKDRRE